MFTFSGVYFEARTKAPPRNSEGWSHVYGEFTGRSCSYTVEIDGTRHMLYKTADGWAAVSVNNRADVRLVAE